MTNHKTLLLLIACFLHLTGLAQNGYFQQEVDYTIDVTLHDPQHTLDGHISIQYHNNSPDTLSSIWINCPPNAFKNDRTAFSEQLLDKGRTDFYFSDKEQRGYINRLAFRVDGLDAEMEDHPQYIDIVRVILPRPLPPGGTATLITPFHVQLPYNFSGDGYLGSSYQITQWYPKPAVFDNHGWHPMPYLDGNAPYSEFGSYDVHITVPPKFIVAATAGLKDTATGEGTKTFHYYENNANDFTWFADRRFLVDHDILLLPSGRMVDVYAYYTRAAAKSWKSAVRDIKRSILFHSALIGEYPCKTATIVQAPADSVINPESLDLAIDDQIGKKWFSGIMGPDERTYPWLVEGLNTYYSKRYKTTYYGPSRHESHGCLNTLIVEKKDQPISTTTEDFNNENFFAITHTKAAIWTKMLQDSLGIPLFDSSMREYFRQWQFKHPYPGDFKTTVTNTSDRNLDSLFSLLNKKGSLSSLPRRKAYVGMGEFCRRSDSIKLIPIIPFMVAFNDYDHFMVGALVSNINNQPPSRLQFFALPLYATVSHRVNGTGGLFYPIYPDHGLQQIQLGIGVSRYSTNNATDSNGHTIFGGFYKFTPSVRIVFPEKDIHSTQELALEWKTYLIGENQLDHYVLKTSDSFYYPTAGKYGFRYLNQLSFEIRDRRVLYPYNATLQLQQASNFYRINFTGNYFFNYARGGGLDLRLFGAKFGYLGSGENSADITRFEPKLTVVRGDEDYTYDNFFVGRSEFTGLASQQIMNRDGDIHLRTDLFQGLQGRSENWVASMNLRTTLPRQIIPKWLPVKLFLDVGTYAEAWSDTPPTSHFLYAGGFELDFFHDVVRIYAPLVFSSDFSNQLRTVPDQDSFWKKISFSIDLRNIDFRKHYGITPL